LPESDCCWRAGWRTPPAAIDDRAAPAVLKLGKGVFGTGIGDAG
jgi:hypothetical protein